MIALDARESACLMHIREEYFRERTLPESCDLVIAEVLRRARRDDLLNDLVEIARLDMESVLRRFAFRAASLAVREADPEFVRLGLAGIGVANQLGLDWRDDCFVLAALWDGAGLIGLDAAREFESAATVQPGAAALFRSWLQREPDARALSEFFIERSRDADGFRYLQGDWASSCPPKTRRSDRLAMTIFGRFRRRTA